MARTQDTEELKPCDLATLATFQFERVLSESPMSGSAYLLGTLHGEPSIVHVQRTAVDVAKAPELLQRGLESLDVFLDNRPYFSANALIARNANAPPDLALKLIWPCTPVHIAKYTQQPRKLLRETPETYSNVVAPYIASFPPERTAWVDAILRGEKEADRVVFRDTDEATGFTIVPDLKWDGVTLAGLYLTAIVQDGRIKTMRDLGRAHLPLLRRIREQAYATAKEKYGVEQGELRLFIHYQPSYYHFHVHIVHVKHQVIAGMAVGQAHMLEDVINWIELSPEDGPALPARMTFTYALGAEHGLYPALAAAQDDWVKPNEAEKGKTEAAVAPAATTKAVAGEVEAAAPVPAGAAEVYSAAAPEEDGERAAKKPRIDDSA